MTRKNALAARPQTVARIVVALLLSFAGIVSPAYAQDSAGSLPSAENTAPATSGAASTGYRITPGDQISIFVLGHDDLKSTLTVLPDGSFDFPIAGHIQAAGLTVEQIKSELISRLSTDLNQPQVSVAVLQTQVERISVIGAVKSPGVIEYKAGWHVLEALAAAGGLAQSPALTQISLIQATTAKNVPIDAVELFTGSDAAQDFSVSPGDVLIVQQRDPSLAEAQVLGQVNRPGVYTVPSDGSSALSLLAQAGGGTTLAGLTQAQIMHQGNIRILNLQHLGSTQEDDRVYPGDVLMIPVNRMQIQVLGEVKTPMVYNITDGDSVPLTTVIASAGGLTSDANIKSIVVLRPGPNGNAVSTSYDMTALLANGSRGAMVQSGDTVYVPTRRKGRNRPRHPAKPWDARLAPALTNLV